MFNEFIKRSNRTVLNNIFTQKPKPMTMGVYSEEPWEILHLVDLLLSKRRKYKKSLIDIDFKASSMIRDDFVPEITYPTFTHSYNKGTA